MPADFGGDIQLTQLINTDERVTADNEERTVGDLTSNDKFVLDDPTPYAGTVVHISAGQAGSLLDNTQTPPQPLSDTPGDTLDAGFRSVSVYNSYQLYLMYKPDGDSIWVTLGELDWHWGGRTEKDDQGHWLAATDVDVSKDPPSFDESKLPQWARISPTKDGYFHGLGEIHWES
jgi:hypothetical protein